MIIRLVDDLKLVVVPTSKLVAVLLERTEVIDKVAKGRLNNDGGFDVALMENRA